jgi:hypothetical protein
MELNEGKNDWKRARMPLKDNLNKTEKKMYKNNF